MALKPGGISACAIMTLIGGIWGIFWSLGAAAVSVCIWIPWLMQFGVSIWAIVHAIRMFGDERVPPSKAIPILFIVTILNCDIVTVGLGIASLIVRGNFDIQMYYADRGIPYD